MTCATPYGKAVLVGLLSTLAWLAVEPALESQTRRRRGPDRLSGSPGKSTPLANAPAATDRVAAATPPLFEDPLTNGRTLGVRDNGQGEFITAGWRVTGASDNIRYTSPFPIEEGALEFDVTGLRFDDTRPQNHRGQLVSMYDASSGDPRHRYSPDLRLNPFKFVLHKFGRDEDAYFANYMKFIMNTDGVNQFEDYSEFGPYPWDEATTYHMRLEWKDGIVRFFINGQDIDRWPFVYRSVYRPQVHDIRIGTNVRNDAIVGATYSNVKIYDFGKVPGPPLVGNPRSTSSLAPLIDWTGERHSHYHVRVNTSSAPDAGVLWDSGEVASTLHYATPATLADSATYFAHVRLRNDRGWGAWSRPHRFDVRSAEPVKVPRYGEHEIVLRTTAPRSSPYTDVSFSATFTGPTESITVNGFWDGGEVYKVRMLPTEAGLWRFTTRSNDGQLNGRTGSFVCEESAIKGYVRVSPSRPYGFEWANGAPFFLMGDTIWHMYYNVRFSDGSFQSLIDDRSAQHFNYAHGVVHDALHNEGGSIYSRQDSTLEIFDVNAINPAYFHWLDQKIDYMNAKGMAAGLFFSWGNGHYQEYQNPSQYERYMRYLVSRYASKNVFWILVGEYEEAGEPLSRWRDYARVVYDADPYKHPISLHTVSTTNAFGNDREHGFIGQQLFGSPEEQRQRIADSRRFGKPVVNMEYGYEGDPNVFVNNQSGDDVRPDHYALALAGGYGIYGNHTPGYSTYHRVGDFVLTATDTPGAKYLAILYEFVTSLNFHRLVPAQHLVDRGIAAAWDGVEYVVQLPEGGAVNVDLGGTRGVFQADWFDPRTGKRTSAGTTEGGARRGFTAPDGNDWILHVHDYPLNDSGAVSVDLGASDIEAGLSRVDTGDGRTTAVDVGGRSARKNTDPASDFYMYFDVSDGFAFEGRRPEAFITVDYFDAGTGTLTLQYDSLGSPFENGGSVALRGTNTWKSHTFHVTDAYFGNRQNGGADFRMSGGVNNTFYLDVVRVAPRALGPPASPSNPEPADRATGVGIRADLSWSPGAGATSHDVYFGNVNPPPARGSQTAATFDPGVLTATTTYFWRIDEVNASGKTVGPTWSFTTQGKPGPAGNPDPPSGASGVTTSVTLAWTPGRDATAHDVYFGTSSPPGFQARVNQPAFDPGLLSPATTYFWRVDEANDAGTTVGPVWSFKTTDAVEVSTLRARAAGPIAVDGSPSDWNLAELTVKVRASENVAGDVALVGYDAGTLYVAGYATSLSLPQSASDHTAKVYVRHDEDRLYFLARVDDDDLRTTFGPETNWANDCVEIYIDPENDRGAAPLDGSTSDVQLVIDALNQRNVYMTTASYRREVLNGVQSAVVRDAAGFWLEVAVDKRALAPDLPDLATRGAISVDFNFRDNDEGNRPDRTTVYSWSDPERSGAFPSKIPDRWGRIVLEPLDRAAVPRPVDDATEVSPTTRLAWNPGRGALSHDVYFGTSSPPPFRTNQTGVTYDPGPLAMDSVYYWRVDTVTAAGKVTGRAWSFRTESAAQQLTLNVKKAGTIQIDGSPADWNLASFGTKARGGEVGAGDVALVGFDDDGRVYAAGHVPSLPLPERRADHTAIVYARHDATYLYFLARVEDDDVRTPFGAAQNWANDCIEIYVDPAGDGGASPMANSTSDVQLVVDAANQRNVYMTTPAYGARILAGVTSAVSRDELGFWVELRIEKRALDPDLPGSGGFGLDFNFRDNDGGNDPRRTTVYTWSDGEESGPFPSKIPGHWGRARLLP